MVKRAKIVVGERGSVSPVEHVFGTSDEVCLCRDSRDTGRLGLARSQGAPICGAFDDISCLRVRVTPYLTGMRLETSQMPPGRLAEI